MSRFKGDWNVFSLPGFNRNIYVGPNIAKVKGGKVSTERMMEIAHLISAAPELYKALDDLINEFENYFEEYLPDFKGLGPVTRRRLKKAYKAMKKARGES